MYLKQRSLQVQRNRNLNSNSNSRVILKQRNGKKQPIYKSNPHKKLFIKETFPNIESTPAPSVASHDKDRIRSIVNKNETSIKLPQAKKSYRDDKNIWRKFDELDKKAEDLIYRRLLKRMGFQTNKVSLKNKKFNDLDIELQNLLKQVKELSKINIDLYIEKESERNFFQDKKIKLMEKLMAEQSIQAQSLKKDYFMINTLNQKKKFQENSSIFKSPSKNSKISIPRNSSSSRSITYESTSKLSFKAPDPDDYEKYRYRKKQPVPNSQPLPRSSYQNDYLYHRNFDPKMYCKNIDTYATLNKSRQISSTYSKDYQTLKTEIVNYKLLDSYRDKFKDLQVSYGRKKENPEEELRKKKRIITQELYQIPKKNIKQDLTQKKVNKVHLVSEFKRQFSGFQSLGKSQIKDKQLTKLKYSYKGFAHV